MRPTCLVVGSTVPPIPSIATSERKMTALATFAGRPTTIPLFRVAMTCHGGDSQQLYYVPQFGQIKSKKWGEDDCLTYDINDNKYRTKSTSTLLRVTTVPINSGTNWTCTGLTVTPNRYCADVHRQLAWTQALPSQALCQDISNQKASHFTTTTMTSLLGSRHTTR